MIRPGRLGVERCGWCGKVFRREEVEQEAVELLGEVVALLVCFVDAALDGGDDRVRRVGRAGFVFRVPEIEVGDMLAGNEVEKLIRQRHGRLQMVVPLDGELILELGNVRCGKHTFCVLMCTRCEL